MPQPVKRKPELKLPQRTERLAVNLFDLLRLNEFVRATMVTPLLNPDKAAIVRPDPSRLDEGAVEFACPLLQAACVMDVLRAHDREAGDHPTRTYLRRAEAWVKLPAAALLTIINNGKAWLNPELFPLTAIPTGPKPRRVKLGRS